MHRVYIYGRGLGFSYFHNCLQKDVEVIAYIDNYSSDLYAENGIRIIKQSEIEKNTYDYIIVSIIKYDAIRESLIQAGVPENQIICFFRYEDAGSGLYDDVIDPFKWKTQLLWKYNKEVVEPTMNNLFYEMNASKLVETKQIPTIISAEETIDILIKEKKSLVRYGDGEFEVMRNHSRHKFQNANAELADRLKEILGNYNADILVAIANNYGDLSNYTDDAANGIRYYMSSEVRKDHMQLLNMGKQYYDAYVSRPYIIYRDKDKKLMVKKFNHIKSIWQDQKVLIVEGKHTRFGVGNDMLNNASDVIRILAPDKNAFDYYDDIFETVKKYATNRLTLIVLGPTATVLAYDLASLGHWALDIGQVDTEYEWFCRGVSERCDVPYKTVSEYADKNMFTDIDEPFRKKYLDEIVDAVGDV